MYPKPVKEVGQARLAIMQWEEKWKALMSELGEGAKIPDLWRMSALLEICPKDVKEQKLLRLDEVGENYENLKVKVISYTSNKAEQSRGQKETAVPMERDYVSGREMYEEEEWDDVDEVRRDGKCHNCGMMGHVAWDCRTKGKGKGKGKDEGKEYSKRQGQDDERNRKERRRQVRTFQGETRRTKTIEDTKDNAGRVARHDTSRRNVDGESTTLTMMSTTWTVKAVAEGVEINQSQRRAMTLVEYRSLGTWKRWKTKPAKRCTACWRDTHIQRL